MGKKEDKNNVQELRPRMSKPEISPIKTLGQKIVKVLNDLDFDYHISFGQPEAKAVKKSYTIQDGRITYLIQIRRMACKVGVNIPKSDTKKPIDTIQ